ncbi:MAG: Fic family protein [Egibacteraceae bacterium]
MLFLAPECDAQESKALAEVDALRQRLRFQVAEPRRWTGLLRRVSMARAIQASNTIEGYAATLDDVLAADADEDPLDAGDATWAAIQGYRAAMDYVLQLSRDPDFRYEASLVRSLHFLMLRHERSKSPGMYRQGTVYVTDQSKTILYEGPDAAEVPALVDELVAALDTDRVAVHAVIRGAMAHLNLVMIHPFRDGNGRLPRVLQSLVLAREQILVPEFASIEEYLGSHTPEYYAVLAEVGGGRWQPERDARAWVRFCLTAHLRQATAVLQRLEDAEHLWLRVEDLVTRQGLPARAVGPLVFASQGHRLRNGIYRSLVEQDITEATATRDLARLVAAGLLEAVGEKRARRYRASRSLRNIRTASRGPSPLPPDPFG